MPNDLQPLLRLITSKNFGGVLEHQLHDPPCYEQLAPQPGNEDEHGHEALVVEVGPREVVHVDEDDHELVEPEDDLLADVDDVEGSCEFHPARLVLLEDLVDLLDLLLCLLHHNDGVPVLDPLRQLVAYLVLR